MVETAVMLFLEPVLKVKLLCRRDGKSLSIGTAPGCDAIAIPVNIFRRSTVASQIINTPHDRADKTDCAPY